MDSLFSAPTKENCKPLEAASKKAKEDFDACQTQPANPVAPVPGQTQPANPVAPVPSQPTEKKGMLGLGFMGLGGKKSKSQKSKKRVGKKSKSQKNKKRGGKKSRSQKKR
jgi:hypothetical protein